ncbi:hypothetical protein CB1_001533104 [Camelus ferus]|nr:hypothetical protein CB1_001533104 [Camelus ferus]
MSGSLVTWNLGLWNSRGLWHTPEPSAHLPGEGEIEDKQLPLSAEAEAQGWSQETDHDDFETLSHQSESHSDTKTDPFESASDTESLPDLTGGVSLPPDGTSRDTEALGGCSDISVTRLPPAPHSASGPELNAEEELDLCLDFKEESYESGFRAFAAVGGEVRAAHLREGVAGPERQSPLAGAAHHAEGCVQLDTGCQPLPAKVVTAQDLRGFSAFPLRKPRSESCLGILGVRPSLLWCSEHGRSWPHIHYRAGGPGLRFSYPLDSTAPQGARTRKGSTRGPAVDAGLPCSQPCFDAPCQHPSSILPEASCLLHAKLRHSAPGNIGGTSPPHRCQPTRTLNRAHSIAEFPLRYCEDALGQNSMTSGTHLKEGTEAEPALRTQNPLRHIPTQLSHSLPALGKPSALSSKGASQDTPSEAPRLENQSGQDSRPGPVCSCPRAELVSLSALGVPVPAGCESEHGPFESRPEEPPGAGLIPNADDVSDKQKHLQDISVEAGNQTGNYTSKFVLSEKRKPPARAKFPHHPSNSRSQVWNRDWRVCSGVSGCSDAPETIPKLSATDSSKEAEVMVPDPNFTKNALQSFSGITAATLAHCSCGDEERAQGHEGGSTPFAEGLQLKPESDTASKGGGALIIIAVEQKGLQATSGEVGPPPDTQSCSFKDQKDKSWLRQSSWRAFLKSKDTEGPKRPSFDHMPGEKQPGKTPRCSHNQKASHMEPAPRLLSPPGMGTWTLPFVSAEDVPGETPSPPRSLLQHSHVSLDDLWLEKTQRRRLKKQAQVERKMHAHKDRVQCWRKMTVTSPESLNPPRRSHPFSQSAPTGLDRVGWPEHPPDIGEFHAPLFCFTLWCPGKKDKTGRGPQHPDEGNSWFGKYSIILSLNLAPFIYFEQNYRPSFESYSRI